MRTNPSVMRRSTVLVVAAVTLSFAAVAATAQAKPAAPTGPGVHYAVTQRFCPAVPKPGKWTCFGEKRVPVAKGTPGARAYTVPPDFAVGPAGGYTPADLAAAYHYNATLAGAATQTVAIVDAHDDPNALSDLNTFNAQYGLPAETATTFRKVNQQGQPAPLPSFDPGWAGEIALDIESVRGACNKCKILLVEADTASSADLAAAVNRAVKMGATVVSNSYGGPESTGQDGATIRAAYDHPGVVITASTGDDGWFSWDRANNIFPSHPARTGASANSANTPSTYPTVVAVGGTNLALNNDATRFDETVWNENGPVDANGGVDQAEGASGGGCSQHFAAPAWQHAVLNYANTGCGTKRLAGDVSAVADPATGFDIFDTSSGGWVTVGGTSLSSPLIAAQYALAGGSGGVDYPAKTLYDRFKHTPSTLFDVAAGGNSFCGGTGAAHCSHVLKNETNGEANPNNLVNGNKIYSKPYPGWAGNLDCKFERGGRHEGTIGHATECDAASGYDGPSGVGAPNGLTLFTPRAPAAALIGPALVRVGHAASFTGTYGDLTGAGGTAVTYHFKWGDGVTTNTSSATVSHTFATKGTYTIALTVTDSNGHTTAPSTRTYTIGIKPSVSIVGPTKFKAHTSHQWSAKVKEVNTGGAITGYTWKLNGNVVAHSPGITGPINTPGTYHLSVTVTDNSGLKGTKTEKLTVTHA